MARETVVALGLLTVAASGGCVPLVVNMFEPDDYEPAPTPEELCSEIADASACESPQVDGCLAVYCGDSWFNAAQDCANSTWEGAGWPEAHATLEEVQARMERSDLDDYDCNVEVCDTGTTAVVACGSDFQVD